MENRQYGYLTHENDSVKIKMIEGQNISGFPIGILYVADLWYPMLPGNVVNGYTYDYPVRLMPMEGLDLARLFRAEDELLEDLIKACKQLKREGVRAITAACGFFGNYQSQLAQAIDLPVAVSSLVQIPWIATLLKPGQKIGVLTADQASLTDKLLRNCGVTDLNQLIIRDLRHAPEFSCILEGRGEFDNGKVREEVVSAAMSILEEDKTVGAILLECSDMPPYASAVQEATKLPVFDFITLINWLHNSVCQTPYKGFV